MLSPQASYGNYFEDFHLNQLIPHGVSRTVSDGDRSVYLALTGARQALYCSKLAAATMGYSHTPLDDMLIFNIAFGKTVADISLNAIANLGYAEVRFLAPVFSGDTLRCESLVIGLKENSNGKTGIVYVRSTCFNQHERAVLSWIRWVMLAKRDAGHGKMESVLPTYSPYTAPADLSIEPKRISAQNLDRWRLETSARKLWDDFTIGERIDHPTGMTLEESDHMSATRLYQNNARVHFDAHHMSTTTTGKRLIYGGHVISICRALSNDGLESVICMAAINQGSHTAPSFAGDTLYATTFVSDKWAVSGRPDLGLLRLRLLGLKNQLPHTAKLEQDEKSGNLQDMTNLVLDLDYTVIVPKEQRTVS